MLKSILPVVALALSTPLFAGNKLVSDPFRAVHQSWKTHPVAGRDFWLLLSPQWLNLKGLENETFIRESGTGFVPFHSSGRNIMPMRVLSLESVKCFDDSGKELSPRIEVIPEESDALVQDPQNLTDKKPYTFTVISGNLLDMPRRYAPLKVRLKIAADRPIKQIRISHGRHGQNNLAEISVQSQNRKISAGQKSVAVTVPTPEKSLELYLQSDVPRYTLQPLNPPYKERLKKAPFIIAPFFRHNAGNVLGMTERNFDQASLARVRNTYGENFLGFWVLEWDSNLFQTLVRPTSAHFKDLQKILKIPCGKEDLLRNMKIVWDAHRPLFGNDMVGMSGQVHFMHHACDWGSRAAAIELTQERNEHAGRVSMMFTRGAARQFDKPMVIYQAYYGSNMYPNSSANRMDFGVAPSLPLRNFYIGYYMGNNYLDFEAQVYGMVKRKADGTHVLTGNGKAMKEIFEWTGSAKGKRGTCYAPILLLADRKHGYDMWMRISPNGWSNFHNLYPLSDANYLLEYVMQVISPRYDYYKYDNPKYSGNLHNSTVGDIFDLYLANPLISGEVRLEQLEKYPVVFLLDDITWTDKLANTLKQYVANGGTLVLTTGQAAPFEDDPDFTGAKISSQSVKADNLLIRKLQLLPGAETVMKTSNGTPLVISKSYGAGKTLLIASPFMKKLSAPTKVPPQLVSLFEKIQSEVLPVQVKGDCEFLFNVMPDGTWKVVLINNRGIVKNPRASFEKHFPEFTSEVTLTVPGGVSAAEIRRNAVPEVTKKLGKTVYKFRIAPAEILVVDLKGIRIPAPVKSASFKIKPVSGFRPQAKASARANDGYRFDPAKFRKTSLKTPEIIACWKAENGMKDSSGNGNHAKLNQVRIADGIAFWETKRSFAGVTFPAHYPIDEGTYELIVKPDPLKKWPKLKTGQVRGGILSLGDLMVEYLNGRWTLLLFDRPPVYNRFPGPAAKPEWTHLALTFKNSCCRFFVNGREIKSPDGPLKTMKTIGKNTFYNRVNHCFGALSARWPEPFSFHGQIKECTFYGRALSPEELAKKADSVIRK